MFKGFVDNNAKSTIKNKYITIIFNVQINARCLQIFSHKNQPSAVTHGKIYAAFRSSNIKNWIFHSDFWSANTQLPVMVSIQSCLSVILSLCQLLKPDYERHLLCFCVLQSMTEIMWNYKRHLGAIIRESNLCLCCYWISISLIKNKKPSKFWLWNWKKWI